MPNRCLLGTTVAAVFVALMVGRAFGAIGPENVLVLYNEASADGARVASYYSEVHPGVTVLGLAGVGLEEEISADDYLSTIRPQVTAALTDTIQVVVTTKGLPLRIVNSHINPGSYTDPFGVDRTVFASTWECYSSLESELAQVDIVSTWEQMGDQTWWIPVGYPGYPHPSRNLYYRAGGAFDHDVYGSRLTCRLDGFTVDDITGSIDRAQQAFVGPYGFVIDNDPNAPGATVNLMEELAQNVLAPTGMPYVYDNTDAFVTDAPFSVVGYVSYGVHGGGEPAPDGYLVDEVDGLTFDLADGAVFHTWESFNAYSFEEGGNRAGQGLVAEWIARGGTAGTGNVQEPGANPVSVVNEDVMFEMLLEGHTWAEAAWSATQQLSFVNTIVGDPLMVFRQIIPGDTNGDYRVDDLDVSTVASHWQESVTGRWTDGDLNCDGVVDNLDISVLVTNWQVGVVEAIAAVPEPSSPTLLLAGLLAWFVAVGRRAVTVHGGLSRFSTYRRNHPNTR